MSKRPPRPGILGSKPELPSLQAEAASSQKELSKTFSPPSGLSAGAKKHFKFHMEKLREMRLLTERDMACLTQLAVKLDEAAKLRKIIEKKGYTFIGANGMIRKRPEWDQMLAAERTAVGLLMEFGFTPASRVRIARAAKKAGKKLPSDSGPKKPGTMEEGDALPSGANPWSELGGDETCPQQSRH